VTSPLASPSVGETTLANSSSHTFSPREHSKSTPTSPTSNTTSIDNISTTSSNLMPTILASADEEKRSPRKLVSGLKALFSDQKRALPGLCLSPRGASSKTLSSHSLPQQKKAMLSQSLVDNTSNVAPLYVELDGEMNVNIDDSPIAQARRRSNTVTDIKSRDKGKEKQKKKNKKKSRKHEGVQSDQSQRIHPKSTSETAKGFEKSLSDLGTSPSSSLGGSASPMRSSNSSSETSSEEYLKAQVKTPRSDSSNSPPTDNPLFKTKDTQDKDKDKHTEKEKFKEKERDGKVKDKDKKKERITEEEKNTKNIQSEKPVEQTASAPKGRSSFRESTSGSTTGSSFSSSGSGFGSGFSSGGEYVSESTEADSLSQPSQTTAPSFNEQVLESTNVALRGGISFLLDERSTMEEELSNLMQLARGDRTEKDVLEMIEKLKLLLKLVRKPIIIGVDE
jgi:hypothetical protein